MKCSKFASIPCLYEDSFLAFSLVPQAHAGESQIFPISHCLSLSSRFIFPYPHTVGITQPQSSQTHDYESFSAHPGIIVESTSQAFLLSFIFFILYTQWISSVFQLNPFPWISTLIPFSFLLQQFVK